MYYIRDQQGKTSYRYYDVYAGPTIYKITWPLCIIYMINTLY